jgi:EAL domain-containing protein (putative c-di-GMP-specific phosphodiesterase class I)
MKVGGSMYPEPATSARELVDQSARASRRSSNGAQSGLYTGSLDAALFREIQIRDRLEAALSGGEGLEMHFQPKLDPSGQIRGAEALARWTDAELGRVSPGEFIPVAETHGLIRDLGRRALREACDWVTTLRRSGLPKIPVSVNVSPQQLGDPRFLDDVVEAVADSGVDPRHLELEITESMLIASADEVQSKLEALTAHGTRISIDDFGTGYSSLRSLRQLPLDALKIDRSFVAGMVDNEDDAAIVQATIALAHGLGLVAVAEGVETREQHLYLKAFRCDLLQGFLLGRPMPPSDLCEALGAAEALAPPNAARTPERAPAPAESHDSGVVPHRSG